MIGLDTNVLTRFIAQDDPLQSPVANRIMNSLTVDEPGWVATATILELVWVLTSKMCLDRAGIAGVFNQMLRQEKLVMEQASVVEEAFSTVSEQQRRFCRLPGCQFRQGCGLFSDRNF